MPERIELEWSYEPKDLFEERLKHGINDYQLVLEDGKATAILPPAADSPERFETAGMEVRAFLLIVGAEARRAVSISDHPAIARISADGGRSTAITVGIDAIIVGGIHPPEVVVTNAGGNIVSDTRAESLARKVDLGTLSARHAGDATAGHMLESYAAAMSDPENELVHLYEICDALATRFTSVSSARAALDISTSWNTLGRLANFEPVKQGRHRGFTDPAQLRDSTADELAEARQAALAMIVAYFTHLGG